MIAKSLPQHRTVVQTSWFLENNSPISDKRLKSNIRNISRLYKEKERIELSQFGYLDHFFANCSSSLAMLFELTLCSENCASRRRGGGVRGPITNLRKYHKICDSFNLHHKIVDWSNNFTNICSCYVQCFYPFSWG